MKFSMKILAGAAMLLAPIAASAQPADVAAAVAATSNRTETNVKLDEGRKPAEVLQFLGLQKGMNVIDMFGANQYWSEIIAPAVGPQGQVVVWQPTQFLNDKRRGEFAQFAQKQGNVVLLSSPFENPLVGMDRYDFLIMNLDYHDVYWQNEQRKIPRMEPDVWLRAIYAAMKPGATLGVIDHVANPGGDTREVVEKLHRIDPAVVRADFERAGFVLDGQSDILRNPADDHSANVFDAAIRGKTDRVIFRFKKPS
ncbi:MAG TPA: methyltransferase [Sphingomicrobium sp.]|jgi:predicted methyltransferase|nr:methyltransferase [Sphingomicrobium sp.]